jgi:ABC-type transporter Mla MlaB component
MIRLTRQVWDGLALKLEGDLSHDVCDLVGGECRRLAAELRPGPLRLDLRDLKSADQAGLRLLRDLQARPDIEFINCSSIWLTLIDALPS